MSECPSPPRALRLSDKAMSMEDSASPCLQFGITSNCTSSGRTLESLHDFSVSHVHNPARFSTRTPFSDFDSFNAFNTPESPASSALGTSAQITDGFLSDSNIQTAHAANSIDNIFLYAMPLEDAVVDNGSSQESQGSSSARDYHKSMSDAVS